jgi:hypothetical protein
MVKLLPIVIVAAIIIGGGIGFLAYKQLKSEIKPSPVPVSSPSASPTASPTATPTPNPSATPKATTKPTTAPVKTQAAAQPGSYSCTLFLGYSQTDNWFSNFESKVADQGKYEEIWVSAGAAHNWSDAGYAGWGQPIKSACSQNSTSPDRIVLDITHDAYLDQQASTAVSYMNGVIRGWINMARHKYPSVKQIVLQPVVGGPNHSVCKYGSDNVRATVNHPYIWTAIGQVANGADIVIGNDSSVGDCSQYRDWGGHLNDAGVATLGSQIASFYH